MYIPVLMSKRGFVRREASPKEVLAHCLRLAQEVAPPTPKGKRGRPWRYGHDLYLSARALVSQHGMPKSGLWEGFCGAPTAAFAAVGYLKKTPSPYPLSRVIL